MRTTERTGWRDAEFVVVDLETTGLDPTCDEIVSFAAIPVRDGRVRPGELTSLLLRPRRAPTASSIRIHGLRERDLADAPTFAERAETIAAVIRGRVLVAHCAWIETRFLTGALAEHGGGVEHPVVDTMALGAVVLERRRTPVGASPSLDVLARGLGLPVHRPHHADGDALTTAQVFLALAGLLRSDRDPTVGELARPRAGRRWSALRSRASRTRDRTRP